MDAIQIEAETTQQTLTDNERWPNYAWGNGTRGPGYVQRAMLIARMVRPADQDGWLEAPIEDVLKAYKVCKAQKWEGFAKHLRTVIESHRLELPR